MCSIEVPRVKVHRFGDFGYVLYECYVDADDVAAFLSVARATVLRWARAGRMPAHILRHGEKRAWRFKVTELDDWLRHGDLYVSPRMVPENNRQQQTSSTTTEQ